MTSEQFEEIAARAEELARKNPKLYRVRLIAMAVGGYAFLLLMLLLLIALLVGIVVLMMNSRHVNGLELKLVIVLGVLVWMMLRSLWVQLSPPEGIKLDAKKFPALFEAIESARAVVGAPRVSDVVINGEFNASVAQTPRLGFFGWYKNQLTLGLPLMECLTPDEFRSVLAHEFGHLSGAHGKLGVWMYRVRQTWLQVVQNFAASGSSMTKLLVPFFKWYVPRFSAFSLAQMRRHEYEADHCATKVGGPPTAANALMRVNVMGAWLEEHYWADIYKQADRTDKPGTPLSFLPARLREFSDGAAASQWLRLSLRRETEGDDTHPALCDRIAAILGSPAKMSDEEIESRASSLMRPERTAAQEWLSTDAAELAKQLDDKWRDAIGPRWLQRYAEVGEQRKALESLKEKAAKGPLDLKEQFAHANLTEQLVGEAEAFPLYRALLAANPGNPQAEFAMGRLLLERKDEAGVAMIESVIAREPEAELAGCQILIKFFYEQGRMDRVKELRRRAETAYENSAEAEQERSNITTKDRFVRHDLPPESVAKIVKALADAEHVKRAWLFIKETKRHSSTPCRMILIERHVKTMSFEDSGKTQTLNSQLVEKVIAGLRDTDIAAHVFVLSGSSPLFKKADRVTGAKIFLA